VPLPVSAVPVLAPIVTPGSATGLAYPISTEVCNIYYKENRKIPAAIDREILEQLKKLEKAAGATLGSTTNPLLVSVRSGAKFSMPGMMDTILNLGLNDDAVDGLKARTRNGRFAFDSYRRFMQMFGSVVLEIPKDVFEHEFEGVKKERGAKLDSGKAELFERRRQLGLDDPPGSRADVADGVEQVSAAFDHDAVDDVVDPFLDLLGEVLAFEDAAALLVDDHALDVHDVVVLEDVLSRDEVLLLDLLLRALDLVREDLALHGLVVGKVEAVHDLVDPVAGEQAHEIVLRGEVKARLAGVALAA